MLCRMPPAQDRPRLDQMIDARRQELDMQWRDLAGAARISTQALFDIRMGRTNPRMLTRRRLEAALRWKPGSIQAIQNGGDPEPLTPETVIPEGELLANALQRSGLTLKQAAERSGLTPQQWQSIVGDPAAERPAHLIANMARVVGVDPAALEGVGREDAAAELRLLTPTEQQAPGAQPPAGAFPLVDEAELAVWELQRLTPSERANIIAGIRTTRVVRELREEKAELAAENEALRAQITALRAELDRLRQRPTSPEERRAG